MAKKINKAWQGSTDQFVDIAKLYASDKKLINKDQEPNVRLIRDYVSRGIITKPKKVGKEVVFGYMQLIEFLACRALINDGWPLKKIADDFQKSTKEEIKLLVPGETSDNDSMKLIKSFGKRSKKHESIQQLDLAPKSHSKNSVAQEKPKNFLGFLNPKNIFRDEYVPDENEPFMNEKQVAYFRKKLLEWKKTILSDSTASYKDFTNASDRALEMRKRDRETKLIFKIDQALLRIERGGYGFCEETGKPIALSALIANPIATLSTDRQKSYERNEKSENEFTENIAASPINEEVYDEKSESKNFVESISPETFFEIGHWAKDKRMFSSVQRNMAFNIAKTLSSSNEISEKLATQAKNIYRRAIKWGFKPSYKKNWVTSENFSLTESSIEPPDPVSNIDFYEALQSQKDILENVSELSVDFIGKTHLNRELKNLAKVLGNERPSIGSENLTKFNITKNINLLIENSELEEMTREKAKAIARAIEINLIIKINGEENSND